MLPTPPKATEGTNPRKWAATPDSNPPNSLEDEMKIALTALTRPRMESGVSTCTRVDRTMTLIRSRAPATTSMAKDNQNHRETPKMTVAAPNPATAQSKADPAFFMGARWAMSMEATKAPKDWAACSQP